MKKNICFVMMLFFCAELMADGCPMCKTLPIHLALAAKRHRDKAKEEEEKGNKDGADAQNKCATLKDRIASALDRNDEKELDQSASEYKQAHERKRLLFKNRGNVSSEDAASAAPAKDNETKPCPKCTNGLE